MYQNILQFRVFLELGKGLLSISWPFQNALGSTQQMKPQAEGDLPADGVSKSVKESRT